MGKAGFWRAPKQQRLRGWMRQVHLWCGIAIGIWTLAIGLSGSVLVFKDEIEGTLHPEVFRRASAPSSAGVAEASLAEVAAAIQQRFPEHALGGFRSLHEPERSGYVWIYRTDASGDLIDRYNVHFDQGSGRILGAVERYTGFPGWLEKLHFFLLLGRPGLLVNGLFAVALVLMCATGVLLWWPGALRLRQGFRVAWTSGWKRLNYDLHSVGGLCTGGFLVLMAFTGMYFCFNPAARAALGWIDGGQEAMVDFFTPPGDLATPEAQTLSPDIVYRQSLRQAGALTVANVTLPRKPGQAFTVDALEPGNPALAGTVRRFVHPTSGDTVRLMDSRQQPFGIRIALAMAPIHFGQWGGLLSKCIWALLGLCPGTLFVTGFLMWWNRALQRRLRALGEIPESSRSLARG